MHANKYINYQVSQAQTSIYQVFPKTTRVEANDCVKKEEKKFLNFFGESVLEKDWVRIPQSRFLFSTMLALMEIFFPVYLWLFPTWSPILAACYIYGHCIKILFPFVQTNCLLKLPGIPCLLLTKWDSWHWLEWKQD